MVSWRPDPGRGGLALGLPPSHGFERGTILERPIMCAEKASCAAGGGPPGPERARSAIMERPFCEPQPVCLENGSSASPPSFFAVFSKLRGTPFDVYTTAQPFNWFRRVSGEVQILTSIEIMQNGTAPNYPKGPVLPRNMFTCNL